MRPYDVLDLHEAGEIGALHLCKAHGDVLDGIREVGDEDVFQGIDPAPGPLYLLCQKLYALFLWASWTISGRASDSRESD